MAKAWEVREIFGNEFAMEQAIEELKKLKGFEWTALDRRNLSVRFVKRNAEMEETVKRTFEMHHGFVESEAPLGDYDTKKDAARQKKLRKEEKKKRRGRSLTNRSRPEVQSSSEVLVNGWVFVDQNQVEFQHVHIGTPEYPERSLHVPVHDVCQVA